MKSPEITVMPKSKASSVHVSEKADPYSTLEVHHGKFIEADSTSAPIVRPDPDFLKITTYDYNAHKETVLADTSVFVDANRSGFKQRTIVLGIILICLVILGAVLGGVLGAAAVRRRQDESTRSPTNTTRDASRLYTNVGLAASQWTGQDGILYKRLYYQGNDSKIRESAWDNSTNFDTQWKISTISDTVKPGTPIGAVAGYPHANYNYTLVKNVYYLSSNGELTERQAKADDSDAWEDDNFTGLYTGSNTTSLSAYWGQNIWNASQELVVLFQRSDFENGITQARYTSANASSNPWVANNFPFAQPKGAGFAISLVSYRSGKHLMLYAVGDDKKLGQYEYTISDSLDSTSLVSLTSQSATPLTIDPESPLAVVAQDNQPLFSTDTLPECYQQTPLTNLIFFTSIDRSSLLMSAWNCTDGFRDHTTEIKPLQKLGTTYLALATMNDRATGDGNLYIMFDSGQGPEIEEWTIPKLAGEEWTISRPVNIDFAL